MSDDSSRKTSAPRIAIIDAYSGSNFGDAAIIDAVIINLRRRSPDVTLTGISLNVGNMERRHGIAGLALCSTPVPYYAMSTASFDKTDVAAAASSSPSRESVRPSRGLKARIKRAFPGLWAAAKRARFASLVPPRELRHFAGAIRFLRGQDLLVVAGGGQLDDEWGGAWGHPYALFKWALAARLTGTPLAVASVGACRLEQRWSRRFVAWTLRIAAYRSFRDANSRAIAASLLPAASADPVVPDLALGIPADAIPKGPAFRDRCGGRPIVAVSPIAFARPGIWATQNADTYMRYVEQMSRVLIELVDRGYFLVFVWSSMPDDQIALSEILSKLEGEDRQRVEQQSVTADIDNWPDFVAAVRNVDIVVASRLHSLVLSALVRKPMVAISFDPKVDWLMSDLRLAELTLDIRTFEAEAVVALVERVALNLEECSDTVAVYADPAFSALSAQFDMLSVLGTRFARR